MPDGGAVPNLTYHRAERGRFAPLIMIAGPSGTGKTYSALKLATGMARGGKICVADTDNSRARLYADEFEFEHLDLREPFRPMLFEAAALAAQKQNAAVLVMDNFSAEHTGPGGLLEWFDEEVIRLAKGDPAKLESMKMLAWAKVKPPHKKMRERLYQLNMPLILCCSAEKKILMVKQTEGRDKGKVIPVDQGFQPIVGGDIPFAMTAALMLLDVKKPGVPVPIKALLPALKPIIHLDRPLDEATGAAIAAWAHGDKKRAAAGTPTTAKVGDSKSRGPQDDAGEPKRPPPDDDISAGGPVPDPESGDQGPPDVPPPDEDPRGDASPPPPGGGAPDRPPDEDPRPAARAREIAELFNGTATRADHLHLVDDQVIRQDMEWIKRNRNSLWNDIIKPASNASWKRTDPKTAGQQGSLV